MTKISEAFDQYTGICKEAIMTSAAKLSKSFEKVIIEVLLLYMVIPGRIIPCHTSCGFATDDYNLWPPFTWMLLIFAMLSGGCTGSTSGGVKNLRLIIIANCIRNQFRQIFHPRAVLPVRAGFPFDNKLVTTVLVFFAAYLSVAFIGWTLLMAFGVDFTEAMSTVISAMGNVGPGLGSFGPAFSWAALPDAAKWILSSLMLIGRLEIFGFLLIFYRSTWKGSWS